MVRTDGGSRPLRAALERIRPVRLAWAERTARVAAPDEIAAAVALLKTVREHLSPETGRPA